MVVQQLRQRQEPLLKGSTQENNTDDLIAVYLKNIQPKIKQLFVQ